MVSYLCAQDFARGPKCGGFAKFSKRTNWYEESRCCIHLGWCFQIILYMFCIRVYTFGDNLCIVVSHIGDSHANVLLLCTESVNAPREGSTALEKACNFIGWACLLTSCFRSRRKCECVCTSVIEYSPHTSLCDFATGSIYTRVYSMYYLILSLIARHTWSM